MGMTTSPSPRSRRRTGRTTSTAAAAMVAVAAMALPAPGAHAALGVGADPASPGCVSDAEYRQLSIGQRMYQVRSVAGDDAQMRNRRWGSGINSYQERLYTMCTPASSEHDTLTARFMRWQGAWRAQIIDTHIGPE
jgi:hypothetical protein